MNSLLFMCITVHFLLSVLVLNESQMVIYTCKNRFSLTSSKEPVSFTTPLARAHIYFSYSVLGRMQAE